MAGIECTVDDDEKKGFRETLHKSRACVLSVSPV